MACCGLHRLKFLEIDDETPGFSEELSTYQTGKCQRQVDRSALGGSLPPTSVTSSHMTSRPSAPRARVLGPAGFAVCGALPASPGILPF